MENSDLGGNNGPTYAVAALSHCSLNVQVNEDIISHIPFLAETGPFQVPVQCLTKKVLVRSSTSSVELNTTVGEKVVQTIEIINDGALPTKFSVEFDDDEGILLQREEGKGVEAGKELHDVQRELRDAVEVEADGVVEGYSSAKVTFTFSPMVAGKERVNLVLRFRKGAVKRLPLSLSLIAAKVAIFVERQEIDLRCCLLGFLYREVLCVRNRGNNALKASPKVPAELRVST